MLGVLFSRTGLICLVVVGIAAVIAVQYRMVQNLREQVTTLNIQTKALAQANQAMRDDIVAIQQLQQQANQTLSTIRLNAAQSAQSVQQRRFTGSHHQIQQQVNQETAAVFGRLQDIGRAP